MTVKSDSPCFVLKLNAKVSEIGFHEASMTISGKIKNFSLLVNMMAKISINTFPKMSKGAPNDNNSINQFSTTSELIKNNKMILMAGYPQKNILAHTFLFTRIGRNNDAFTVLVGPFNGFFINK